MFGIYGEKGMRFWPPNFYEKFENDEIFTDQEKINVRHEYYQKHKEEGDLVALNPGDMVYWPTQTWHVGEAGKEFSVSLVIAFTHENKPYDIINDSFNELLNKHPLYHEEPEKYPYPINDPEQAAQQLPENLREAKEVFVNGVAQSAVFEKLIMGKWLAKLSGLGIMVPPKLNHDLKLDTEEIICVKPEFPILWNKIDDNEILYAANGYWGRINLDSIDNLIELIKKLNSGKSFHVKTLLHEFSVDEYRQEQLKGLLNTLYSWKAIYNAKKIAYFNSHVKQQLFQRPKPQKIDTIFSVDPMEFIEKYVSKNIPVVIKGGVKNWEAIQRWNDAYLRNKCGDTIVNVEFSNNAQFGYNDPTWEIQDYRFSDFLDQYQEDKNMYMVAHAPESLMQDVFIPEWAPFFNGDFFKKEFFWMGGGGQVSLLHNDHYDNFLCMVSGRKKIKLFDGFEGDLLYENINFINKVSPVNVDNPDYKKYPKLEFATSYEVEIEAGDILYIPIFWFHQVYSYDRNIALNTWFDFHQIKKNMGNTEGFNFTSKELLSMLLQKKESSKNSIAYSTMY